MYAKRLSLFIAVAMLTAGSVGWCQQPEQPAGNKDADVAVPLTADRFTGQLSDLLLLDVSRSLLADNGLGIDMSPPDAALRAQLGLEEGSALVVVAAPEESTGAKAGLKVHDVVVQFGDQKLGVVDRLNEWLSQAEGKAVTLKVLRGGKPIEIQVTPKKPDSAKIKWRTVYDLDHNLTQTQLAASVTYRIGVSLAEADATLRSHLRLAAGEGLVVTDVIEGSAAAAAGIQANDVLIVLDGKRLTTVEAINNQVQEIKDRQVELRLLRGGKEVALQVAPRKTYEAAFHDQALRLWDMKDCQKCHVQPLDHEQAAHLLLKGKLGAMHSAWTDGHTLMLHGTKVLTGEKPASGSADAQIAALKTQLAEMQKTLAALETSLAAPKTDDKRDEEK